jgi:hypothetical protein
VIGDSLQRGRRYESIEHSGVTGSDCAGLITATVAAPSIDLCRYAGHDVESEIVQEIVHLDDVIHNNGNGNNNGGGRTGIAHIRLIQNSRIGKQRVDGQPIDDDLPNGGRKSGWSIGKILSVDDDENVENVEPESRRKLVVQWCKRKAAEIQRCTRYQTDCRSE